MTPVLRSSVWAALAAGIAAMQVLLLVQLEQIRGIERDVSQTQRCIIGTLLDLPDQRRNTSGARFDELCGFPPGTANELRTFFGVDLPEGTP